MWLWLKSGNSTSPKRQRVYWSWTGIHSLALFDVAPYATLHLGGSDAQRLGRANRLKSWRETCLSCTLPARFTRDPPGRRVSFVGRVRLTNNRARNEIPIESATSKLTRWACIAAKRLLTTFDKRTFQTLCPITIRPKPTELARVGIILTELDFQPPTDLQTVWCIECHLPSGKHVRPQKTWFRAVRFFSFSLLTRWPL